MSKIAPHVETPTLGQMAWARRAVGVKQFRTGSSVLAAAAEANPDAVLVYRAWPDTPDANAVLAQLGGFRAPNLYIELRNEPVVDTTGELFAEIEAAVPVCRQAGVRLAALSLSTGNPEPDFWAAMRDRGWCGLDPSLDAIALHEYSYAGEIDGWNMGRFQKLIEAGWTGAILITECGIDDGTGPGGGWRRTNRPDWPGTEAAFEDLLQRYDALLAQYPQVLIATVFSADNWPSFYYDDPSGLFSRLSSITTGDMRVTSTSTPGLSIGPGFQKWIQAHQATPLESEEFHNDNGELVYSRVLVLVGDADGVTKDPVELRYVAATNQIYEFPFPKPWQMP
jgi:hypothetical protein